jgi:hypothetical protein
MRKSIYKTTAKKFENDLKEGLKGENEIIPLMKVSPLFVDRRCWSPDQQQYPI